MSSGREVMQDNTVFSVEAFPQIKRTGLISSEILHNLLPLLAKASSGVMHSTKRASAGTTQEPLWKIER